MTTQEAKDRLYRLVEVLPERELTAAARYLEYLASSADPVAMACALAPDDDEPVSEEERTAVEEARIEFAEGSGIPLEQVRRELRL